MTMTKKDALDLLGDLFDTPVKPTVPSRFWRPVSIGVVYTQRTCKHCGHIHTEVSPKVLIKEEQVKRTGEVIATSLSCTPKTDNLRDYQDLPVQNEYLDAGTLPFCTECVEEFSQQDLFGLITIQSLAVKEKEDGEKKERSLISSYIKQKGMKETQDEIFYDESNTVEESSGDISLDDLLEEEGE